MLVKKYEKYGQKIIYALTQSITVTSLIFTKLTLARIRFKELLYRIRGKQTGSLVNDTRLTDEHTDGLADGRTNGWADGRTNGWTDRDRQVDGRGLNIKRSLSLPREGIIT